MSLDQVTVWSDDDAVLLTPAGQLYTTVTREGWTVADHPDDDEFHIRLSSLKEIVAYAKGRITFSAAFNRLVDRGWPQFDALAVLEAVKGL